MGSLHESDSNASPNKSDTQSQAERPQLAQGRMSRNAHAFAQWLLRVVKAHDVASWDAGHSSGYVLGHEVGRTLGHETGLEAGRKQGRVSGHKEGLEAGWDQGIQEGFDDGHRVGFEAGKLVLELNPGVRPSDVAPGVDTNLFEHFDFPISVEVEKKIRADIEAKLPSYQQPTEPQWEMILSRSPSTFIAAGAGSGKSTTMVLRLLVLRHYLNVPEDRITVVTFTRDSRFDFIAKVIKIFKLWKIPMDEKKGMSFIRTFHSRILDFFKWSPSFQGAKAFEFLSKDQSAEDEEPENVLDIRLNVRQLD